MLSGFSASFTNLQLQAGQVARAGDALVQSLTPGPRKESQRQAGSLENVGKDVPAEDDGATAQQVTEAAPSTEQAIAQSIAASAAFNASAKAFQTEQDMTESLLDILV